MSDTPSPRNWSTKTLARELIKFLDKCTLSDESTLADLLAALRDHIVEEEVGLEFGSFGSWGKGGG